MQYKVVYRLFELQLYGTSRLACRRRQDIGDYSPSIQSITLRW